MYEYVCRGNCGITTSRQREGRGETGGKRGRGGETKRETVETEEGKERERGAAGRRDGERKRMREAVGEEGGGGGKGEKEEERKKKKKEKRDQK